MGEFVHRIRVLAIALGAPGLFIVAFLDSSILSLPEIADLLVIYMVVRHKPRVILYAASATVGSIAGCVFLYILAKKGEEALIRRRFSLQTIEKTLAVFKRCGVLAVLIPALLPPPAPFKIFVLLAGAAGIQLPRFIATVAIGRGLRFFAIGLIAVRYGDRTIAFVHEHGTSFSLAAAGVVAVSAIVYIAWSRTTARRRP
jgi:membrane protein YqaA with SNARE-associated domain